MPRPSQVGTGLREGLDEPAGDPLAGDLHQAERPDLEHLRPGLVIGQRLASCVSSTCFLFFSRSMSMKSITMMPPMSRSRSCRATSSAASRFVFVDGLLEVRLADGLAGVDVDDRHGLGALDEQVAARREPDLAVERLVDLLDDVVLLEHRQRALVHRDLRREVGATSRRYSVIFVVDARRVGHELLELLVGEQVAHDANGELGLLVEDRAAPCPSSRSSGCRSTRRASRARSALRSSSAGALGGGADDHAVPRRLDLLQDRLEALALVVGQPAADAGTF